LAVKSLTRDLAAQNLATVILSLVNTYCMLWENFSILRLAVLELFAKEWKLGLICQKTAELKQRNSHASAITQLGVDKGLK